MKAIVDSFIADFANRKQEYDAVRYQVRRTIQDVLDDQGIMAIVTARVKRRDRLEEKLYDRDERKDYQSFQDIYDDIPDLIGARIALYFPGDSQKIKKLLEKDFDVLRTKHFPEGIEKDLACEDCDKCTNCQQPGYTANLRKIYEGYDKRRFDGYCATHYRVKLKDRLAEMINNPTIEIQVASVLMHAWSEVEHDLAYKKKRGEVSREEYEALDEINGLVIAGEIALNRLDQLSQKRLKEANGGFTTHYALAAYLAEWLEREKKKVGTPIGDTEALFTVYQHKGRALTRRAVDGDLKKLVYKEEELLADQLIDLVADGDAALTEMIMHKRYRKPASDAEVNAHQMLGKYIVDWTILEDEVKRTLRRLGFKVNNSSDIWRVMTERQELSEPVRREYRRLRLERNKIAHGNYRPTALQFEKLEADMVQFRKLLEEEYPAA